ncbi:MAG: hypothetical protein AAFV78_02660 [Bacteroidota bacterium]
MRKTLVLLGVLMVGLGIFYFFIWDQGKSSLWGADTDFAIEDTSSITRIQLVRNVKGQPTYEVTLSRNLGEEWVLNGQYPALTSRVNKLLSMMRRLQVRQLLNEKGESSGKKIIETVNTHVTAYAGDREIKSYYVGTQTQNAKGTLMLMEGASIPYVVELPGLQGYLNTYFPMDLMVWRENLLFKAEFDMIESFSVSYLDQPESNFILKNIGDSWRLDPDLPLDSVQSAAFREIFSGKIYAEEFVTAYYPGKLAELKSEPADREIYVRYKDGTSRDIYMYVREENPNNFFAWIEGEPELVTVQHFVIDKFLKKKSDLLAAPVISPGPEL